MSIDNLSVSERLQLIEDLWDSIDHDHVDNPLSDEQKAEVEDRHPARFARAFVELPEDRIRDRHHGSSAKAEQRT